jgi:hypothetical protein
VAAPYALVLMDGVLAQRTPWLVAAVDDELRKTA